MQAIAWIDPEVFEWEAYSGTSMLADPHTVRRAYAHWRHAEQVLAAATTEFHRIDVITTLKRAVDHRLRLLNEAYRWKKLRVAPPSDGSLQLLETLGIARHSMVSRLITLRNRVEHGDREPPPAAECEVYVDLVWYFLRATDVLAMRVPETVEFEAPDETGRDYAVTVRTGPEVEWRIEMQGHLAARHVSLAARDGWARVALTRRETRGDWLAHDERPASVRELHEGLDPSDLFVAGEIVGPDDTRLRIYQAFLGPM